MNLQQRDQHVIWHPYTQMQLASPPLPIVKGEGSYLITEDGTRYLDLISSWWVNLHGHAHPHLAAKMSEQLSVLEQVIFADCTHPPAVELAERLLAVLPDQQARVFFSDNGSTAVEVALKMALQFWHNQGTPKQKVVAFKEAYHGDTFGAMSVSARGAFTQPYADLLFDVHYIDYPEPGKEDQTIQQFQDLLDHHQDIAAFIFEPLILGASGMLMYEPKILDQLMAMAQAHEVLTIADEVMTGFGRTGKLFACHHLQHQPDMMCLSKGLTGGSMAMSITTCTAKIYEAFLSDDRMKMLFHGHSFTANSLGCAAALASLDLTLSDACKTSWQRIETAHRAFAETIAQHPKVRTWRLRGTILAIELETGENTSYFNTDRDAIYRFFLERGLLLRPLGNVIYILPPYCTTNAQLAEAYEAITELLNQEHL